MTTGATTGQLALGRRILRVIAVIFLPMEIFRQILDAIVLTETNLYIAFHPAQGLMMAGAIILSIGLWLGKNWARWITGIGCVLLTAIKIGTVGAFFQNAPIIAVINIVFGILYALGSYFLIVDKSVEAFSHQSLKK